MRKKLLDRVFTRDQQKKLQDHLGDAAGRLMPRLAQAAAKYKESERESDAQAERRREIAQSHIAVLNASEKAIGQLLERLQAMNALIPQASKCGYLPGSATSGSLGRLTVEVATQAKLEAIREAAQMALGPVGEWREIARLDTRLKRGQKVGDRWRLNEWVVIQLAREGVALRKYADGRAARVLEIVHEAAGINRPQDLYRDVCRAIDDTARARQHLH